MTLFPVDCGCFTLTSDSSSRRALSSRVDMDDDKCNDLEEKLKVAQARAAEAENRADEVNPGD